MTSPLCPPCRLHELVREWDRLRLLRDCDPQSKMRRYAFALQELRLSEAAQQLPDAAAHCPDMPAVLRELSRRFSDNAQDQSRSTGSRFAWIEAAATVLAAIPPTDQPCPAGSPQTDHGASIAACAHPDRHPHLYALIQSGADVCAAIEAVLTEQDRLRQFARDMFAANDWPRGGDIDGCDFQEFAQKNGLLMAEERTESCGEGCECEQYGEFPMTCYRKVEWLR